MIFIRQKIIKREDLVANRTLLYVFGDNLERKGYGGQAKEMRGEVNACGIVTKRKAAHGSPDCYFNDLEAGSQSNFTIMYHIQQDLKHLESRLYLYDGIVFPMDGIGTGLAKMPQYAPSALAFIDNWFNKLEERLNSKKGN